MKTPVKPNAFQRFAYNLGSVGLLLLCGVFAACQAAPPGLPVYLGHQPLWQQGEAVVAGAPMAYALRPGQGPWRVFIEGDGNAFTAQGRASVNPTPSEPVALELAILQPPGRPVLYLGRPCQWVSPTAACIKPVWTSERFTTQVLADYTDLIARLTDQQPAELIGFSGGAWVAYGVAQQLPQVGRVVTVAGNLNPNLINRHHRVPEMVVAPWPVTRQNLSLLMLWGERDSTIPPKLAESMAQATVAGCKESLVLPDLKHASGWPAWWAAHEAKAPVGCGFLPSGGLPSANF